MENPIKMDDLGVPFFFGNTHMLGYSIANGLNKFPLFVTDLSLSQPAGKKLPATRRRRGTVILTCAQECHRLNGTPVKRLGKKWEDESGNIPVP